MIVEIRALESNHTWTLTSLPNEEESIGSKYVYTNKYNSDGSFVRYKAKLVAKEYTHVEWLYFQKIFS